jgi:hypothetical protein
MVYPCQGKEVLRSKISKGGCTQATIGLTEPMRMGDMLRFLSKG